MIQSFDTNCLVTSNVPCLRVRAFFKKIFWLFLILPLVSACAPEVRKQDREDINLFWPLPPDDPKIHYIGALRSTRDVESGRGIADRLFGRERGDALKKPYSVAVDEDGKIYVTDLGRVMFFYPGGRDYGYLGDKPGPGKLSVPIGIAVSKDGRIFVTDSAVSKVFIYSPDGRLIGHIGREGEFDTPAGIAIDEGDNKIYIVDTNKHRVGFYALDDYTLSGSIGTRGITEGGKFNFPTNVAVDSKGNLYVADTGNFRVQVFDRDGTFLRSIGRLGTVPGSFTRPKGIAFDSQDHVYVVDAAFQNVQIFDSEGRLLLFFGKGGWGPGSFTLPAGIHIDSDDKIYVVDQWPGNVQIFQFLGIKHEHMQGFEERQKE